MAPPVIDPDTRGVVELNDLALEIDPEGGEGVVGRFRGAKGAGQQDHGTAHEQQQQKDFRPSRTPLPTVSPFQPGHTVRQRVGAGHRRGGSPLTSRGTTEDHCLCGNTGWYAWV